MKRTFTNGEEDEKIRNRGKKIKKERRKLKGKRINALCIKKEE